MADVAIVLAAGLVLDIDAGTIGHLLLRQVEHVAVRIVRGDPGERARARPLHIIGAGIFGTNAVEHGLDLLDLDAEMVEPRRTPGLARVDVEADIAVAYRDGAVRARLGPRRHAEERLVERCEQRISFADDGDVIDLRKHGVRLRYAGN